MPAPPSTASNTPADRDVRGRRAVLVDRALQVSTSSWAVLIVVLSLVPDDPSGDVAWDKARHGAAYAVLTALVLLSLVWRPARRPRPRAVIIRTALALAVAVVVLGGVVEVLQAEVVDRDGSWGDLLADAIGVAAAGAAWAGAGLLARRRLRARRRQARAAR
jgi:VanZ family protein